MSNTATADAAQPTLSADKAIAYLRDRAPVAIGDGPDATKLAAAAVARKIGPAFPGGLTKFEAMKVLHAMRQHWLPRCFMPLDDDTLFDIIEEAKIAFEKEQKSLEAKERARQRAAEVDEYDAESNEEDQESKANQLREKLNCSLRWAYMLLDQGHASRAVCEKLAEVQGGDWTDYKRTPSRRGRRVDLVEYLMRPYFEGYSFRDFVTDPPQSVQGAALDFCREFEAAYDNGADFPDHIHRLETVAEFAIENALDSVAALQAWSHYKAWRIARVAEWLSGEAQTMTDLDFDFG